MQKNRLLGEPICSAASGERTPGGVKGYERALRSLIRHDEKNQLLIISIRKSRFRRRSSTEVTGSE